MARAAPDASGSSSSSPVYSDPGQLWPDATRTVVTSPQGRRPPLPPLGEYEEVDLRACAEQHGQTFEQVRLEQFDVTAFHDFVAADVEPLLGDRFSEARPAMAGEPAWVGFSGDVPPEVVTAAEAFHLPLELRGGALLTEAEADRVRSVGFDTARDLAPEGVGMSGHLDAPTATCSVSGFPAEEWQPGDGVRAAVVAAAVEVLGRDAPFRVVLEADARDPETTGPAFWYLPAGWEADPAATSLEVVVDAPQCASGVGRTLVDVHGDLRGGSAGPGGGLVAPAAG